MEPKQQPPYPLRMPQELREALEKEATLGKRSLNAEVVGRLELSLARQQEAHAELRARKRALSRQMLEIEAQLMGVEEILVLRRARLDTQIGKNPAKSQLEPLHTAVSEVERVVDGFRAVLKDAHARMSKIDEQIARAIEHDKQLGFGEWAE